MKRTTIDKIMHTTRTQNQYGEWVTAIPEPYRVAGLKVCFCEHAFFTERGYKGHYALEHILYYK